MLDPRTRDAIRAIPEALEAVVERLDNIEKMLIDVHKFTRSTNESVVRKYGGGEKNTVAKVLSKVTGNKDES